MRTVQLQTLPGNPIVTVATPMKCPACDRPLTDLEVGQLHVAVCQGGCGGVWFATFELQRVSQENTAAGMPLLHIPRDPAVVVDPARDRACPRCASARLKRVAFRPGSRVNVDECPQCGGCWFDDGELEKLCHESKSSGDTKGTAEPCESDDLIKYLYEVRTGHRRR